MCAPLTCRLPALTHKLFFIKLWESSPCLCLVFFRSNRCPLHRFCANWPSSFPVCEQDSAALVCVLLLSSCNHPSCLPGVQLACIVIVTMEKLPSACMPHLLLLLLSVTLIRMVEDLGQRLLLPPKRTEKPPPNPPFLPLSLFLFLSQARPHTIPV